MLLVTLLYAKEDCMSSLFGPSFKELAAKEIELRKKQKAKLGAEKLSTDLPKEANYKKTSILYNKPFVIIISFLIVIIISYSIGYFIWNPPFIDSKAITYVEFDKIENGMSYTEVTNIIGSNGQLLSSVDMNIGSEYATQIYVWYGSNSISNANVTFQGGKVTIKAQFGLN
jgi:hypothetical protein